MKNCTRFMPVVWRRPTNGRGILLLWKKFKGTGTKTRMRTQEWKWEMREK